MATTTFHDYNGDGSDKTFNYTFPTYSQDEVVVEVSNVIVDNYTIPNYSTTGTNTVTFDNSTGTVNTTVCESDGSPKAGTANVRVYRDTDVDSQKHTYQAGSAVKAGDLNTEYTHILRALQEEQTNTITTSRIKDDAVTAAKVADGAIDNAAKLGTGVVGSTKILNNAVTTEKINNDAVTADKVADGAIDNAAKLGTGVVGSTKILNNAVTTEKINNDAVTADKVADGAIDNAAKLGTGVVGSTKILDNAVTTAKINNDAVTADKIADGAIDNAAKLGNNVVGSDKILNNAVITAKINNDAVTADKIADGAIDNAAKLGTGVVGSTKILDNAVTSAKINADAVTGAKIADDSINSEHYVDGSIDTAHIADGQVTSAKISDGTIVDGDIATNAGIAHTKLANGTAGNVLIINSSSKVNSTALSGDVLINSSGVTSINSGVIVTADIADDAITAAKVADGAIDNADKLGTGVVGSTKILDNAVTVAKIADAELTTLAGMQAGTASVLAGGTALAATLTEINTICDGKGNQTTITDSDAHYPTSGAVVDYVAAQIAPIGGLEVIATDAAFPNTQPVSGVVISIADAGGLVVDGSGSSTTGRTVGGSTVTINGINSSYNSSTVTAGIGFLVTSTGTGQVYNFHKSVIRDQDILSISTDIDDFANRYRVHNGEPSSNNDDGDMVWDTNANKMKVYDATNSAWKEVTSTGDFKFLVPVDAGTTTAATWDGSDTSFDLKETTNSGSAASVTNINQLIISLNGVIQKPNTGSYDASEEGFYLTDADTIRFCTAPPTGSSVFILQIGSAVSIPTPGDNTVATAKIQNGAVTLDKIASEAVDEDNLKISNAGSNGQFLSKQSGNTGGLTWATVDLTAATDYADNVKVRFGTGNDLEIYHDGSNSYISEVGTGSLTLASNGSGIWFQKDVSSSENLAIFRTDGACELNYDAVKKFETTSSGATVTGSLGIGTSSPDAPLTIHNSSDPEIRFGYSASQDHSIGWDSSQLHIHADRDDATDNSTMRLYVDGTERLKLDDSGNVDIANDSGKLRLGAGSDLQIYHDGTDSYIKNVTGHLKIYGSDTDDKHIYIRPNNGEDGLTIINNGAVELYYDASKKLETTSSGAKVSGDLQMGGTAGVKFSHTGTTSIFETQTAGDSLLIKTTPSGGSTTERLRITDDGKVKLPDNGKIIGGAGEDLELYSDGNNAILRGPNGDLYLQSDSDVFLTDVGGNETFIKAIDNGAVELYYDNVKALETKASGINVWGSSGDVAQLWIRGLEGRSAELVLMADDGDDYTDKARIHQSTNGYMYIQNETASGTWESMIICRPNGPVELYCNNTKRLHTGDDGISVEGYAHFGDGGSGVGGLGIGNVDDLTIFHDGTNSYIKNGTGHLRIYGAPHDDTHIYLQPNDGENGVIVLNNGGVDLYYDNVKKFGTASAGVEVTGALNHYAGSYVNNSGGHVEIGNDSGRLKIGTGHDLSIYHDSGGGPKNVIQNDNSSHLSIEGDNADEYLLYIHNDGNNNNRHGIRLLNGSDSNSGTHYAVAFCTGDNTAVGYISHASGTVSYGAFTAHHPCIVPNSDNKSDGSDAYPYGTLLETISIEYTKDGSGNDTERGIKYNVQKTQSANSRKVLGAYGSSMVGSGTGETNMHQALVLGDGHILCNNAGGNIEVGDGICSSNTAGIGQKATVNPSMIIGIAQEAVTFTGSETKLVAVQYGVQQFIPWT